MFYFRIVISVLALIAYWFVLRYNLHMFQLNGYKNDEHMHWLKIKWRKQALAIVLFVTALLLLAVGSMNVFCHIILLFELWIFIKFFRFQKEINTKKKLVFTMRVKRLMATKIILSICLVVVFFVLFKVSGVLPGICIATSLTPVSLVLANILNAPLEKAVNNYYINDAKNILKKNSHIKVIGVTGSYGKTSVKFYLNTLLSEKFNVLVTPESYNTPMGIVKTIRGSMKSSHEIFICEMGARRVSQIKEICDIVNPQHGIITSVGPQHLETFGSIDNVLKTKFELADSLPEGGMLFLNGDNELIVNKAKEYENTYFYSAGEESLGYHAENIELSQLGTKFTVAAPNGERCEFQTRLVGQHNVVNIVGAIAVANTLGISLEELKVPVRKIQSVPHRMQLIERGNVTVIDDAFNSNPVGSKAAVETLKLFDGLRILITPGMVELGDKEEEYNFKFGGYAAQCCDYIFLVGKKRTEAIMNGALHSGFSAEKCIAFDNLSDAMAKATSISSDKHKFILLENDLPDNY